MHTGRCTLTDRTKPHTHFTAPHVLPTQYHTHKSDGATDVREKRNAAARWRGPAGKKAALADTGIKVPHAPPRTKRARVATGRTPREPTRGWACLCSVGARGFIEGHDSPDYCPRPRGRDSSRPPDSLKKPRSFLLPRSGPGRRTRTWRMVVGPSNGEWGGKRRAVRRRGDGEGRKRTASPDNVHVFSHPIV